VHGGGSCAVEWAPLLPELAPTRRWVLVDRPGHGYSYRIDYSGLDFRRAAVEYMLDLLDGLGVARASFVANSMGGYFALCLALAHPERVDQLVLLGAPAGIDRWIPPALRLMGLPWFNRSLFRMMRNPSTETIREQLFERLLVAHPERVDSALIEAVIRNSGLPGAELAWRTLLESVLTPLGFRRRYGIREEVASLSSKTTFVWGDKDAFSAPSSGRALARNMHDAQFIELPDAGHLPWLDAPAECAKYVEAALGRHVTPPTPLSAQQKQPRAQRKRTQPAIEHRGL
jgi:pimeloyl-ACP methyl ester carboxylesterase